MNAPRNGNTTDGADWLDALLKEDAATYLPDDGFTHRVLASMPAKKPLSMRLRRWVPAVATALGAIVALCVLPGTDVFLDGVADLLVADFTSAHVAALAGTLVVFIGVAIALATDR